jgi:DHA1 family multidrug resistance protein-like MFS transporter
LNPTPRETNGTKRSERDDVNDWRRALIIMSVAQLLSAIGFSMIFPFLPNYVEALGSSTGTSLVFWAGAVFSAQAITMMIASPLWGATADRFGRKPMVARAMFGGAVIILLMAFARSAEELTLLRAVQGLITGIGSAANALIASITPKERSGYAMGVLQTALWSGVAVGPVMGGVLADLYGFRIAFVATAALLLVGGLLVAFGVREEFQPRKEAGRSMLGDWDDILRTPGVAAAFSARFTASLGRGLLVPVLPLFIPLIMVGSQGTGTMIGTMIGLVIGIASATGTVSAIILGNLGDRIGHRRILVWSALLAALSYLPMALVTHPWQLLLLNAVSGIAIGGIMPSLSALLTGYSSGGSVGSAFGLDNSVMSGSRAVAPLVGVGVASLFGYRAAFLAGSVVFLLTLAVAASRLPDPRPRAKSPAGGPGLPGSGRSPAGEHAADASEAPSRPDDAGGARGIDSPGPRR